MNHFSKVASSAFVSVFDTIFPLLSLPLVVLYPMPSHFLFPAFFQLLSLSFWIRCLDLGS